MTFFKFCSSLYIIKPFFTAVQETIYNLKLNGNTLNLLFILKLYERRDLNLQRYTVINEHILITLTLSF